MFLPVKTAVDLPMIPVMGKDSIPVVSALVGCWLIKEKKISYFKELGNIKYLVILFLIVPFITASLNSDSITKGGYFLPSLTYYDGLSATINQFLLISPFFIGRQFFRTYSDQLAMLKLIVVAGLFYSILMLFEVRLSPQLHTWVYGYFPHSFGQQMREGGFRPVVFMGHGLLVAFFTVIVLIASSALWINRIKVRQFSPKLVSSYMLVVLVLCKSIASLFYGVIGLAMVILTKPKLQLRATVILVCLALFYPTMSIIKIFPHQWIVNTAELISPERAQSLNFRFENENILLTHGRERFFFGWGGWGRNRVYNEESGRDETVTDGRWIITFGQFGIFGFIAEFGLLAITVFQANKALRLLKSKPERNLLAAHALLVGVIMIDQLPNASLAPWLWLIAGILLGRSGAILAENKLNKPISQI